MRTLQENGLFGLTARAGGSAGVRAGMIAVVSVIGCVPRA